MAAIFAEDGTVLKAGGVPSVTEGVLNRMKKTGFADRVRCNKKGKSPDQLLFVEMIQMAGVLACQGGQSPGDLWQGLDLPCRIAVVTHRSLLEPPGNF